MSNTPHISRRTASGASQAPPTPDSPRPVLTRTTSLNIAPKSEYLRNALEATRARQASPAPSPIEPKSEPKNDAPAPSSEAQTSLSEPDEWLEQALADADACPPSPLGRRRPSDTPPRARTTRELRQETDSLKRVVWDLNMKLEMARKQNNQLKDELDVLREQNEELKPLGQENKDLWKENDELKAKLQDMEDDIAENETLHLAVQDLEVELARLQAESEELRMIQADSIKHMEAHDHAILEGAEIIHNFEVENKELSEENAKLKEQLAALQASLSSCTEVDGCPREMYPSRVYSIDESRPSTSHFDSDYFSQPGSPQVKASVEPVATRAPSERAKNFLERSKDYRKSSQDLKKRISDVSLKGLKHQTSVPEVPEIPEAIREQTAQTHQEQIYKAVKRTPRRQRALTPLDTVQVSPVATRSAPPVTPTSQNSRGLRGLYRVGKSSVDHSTRDRRPSSSSTPTSGPLSSLDTRNTNTPRPSTSGERPYVYAPPRTSSKQADTCYSSNEKMRQDSVLDTQSRSSQPRHHSASDLKSSSSTLSKESQPSWQQNSEWIEVPPPPSTIISEAPSTTHGPLDHHDQDRWWKEIDRLKLSGAKGAGGAGRRDIVSGLDALATGGRRSNTAGTPLVSPYVEKDFFFNGAEDEEQFMRKARGYRSPGSRD